MRNFKRLWEGKNLRQPKFKNKSKSTSEKDNKEDKSLKA